MNTGMHTGYLRKYGITKLPTQPLNLTYMQGYSHCKRRLRQIRAKFREEGNVDTVTSKAKQYRECNTLVTRIEVRIMGD